VSEDKRGAGVSARTAALALALMTVVAFLNATPSIALYDDGVFAPLTQHASWSRVAQVFRQDTWVSAGKPAAGTYRPLFLGLIVIEGMLFDDAPRALHATVVGLHVATTLLLFGFLLRVLRDAWPGAGTAPSSVPLLAAWVTALIFGVHPVHTEAIDSFFNGSEVIATLGTYGMLWLVWTHAPGRPLAAWAGASAIFFVTLLFRESAATAPVILVIVLGLLRFGGDLRARARQLARVAVLLLVFVVYAAIRGSAASWPTRGVSRLDNYLALHDWSTRLALVASTTRDALKLLVWPHPLRVSYDEYEAHDVVAALLVNALVIALAALSWRRRPALTAGVFAFYVALLPSTSLVQDLMIFPGIFAERYLYLPSAALTIPLAFALAALAAARGPVPVAALAMGAYVICTPLTLLRNDQWHGELQLLTADYRIDPANGRNAEFLCARYQSLGRTADAVALCDRYLAEHPTNEFMADICSTLYRGVGRGDDALLVLRRAAEPSTNPHLWLLLARLRMERGERGSAETAYTRSVEHSGNDVSRHLRRGEMLLVLHPERAAEARAEFQAALDLDPTSAVARDWLRRTSASDAH
jgi:protein O-mannosyl-transferase